MKKERPHNTISGVIRNAEYAFQRKVKVNPIRKQYHDLGEPEYYKYNCPVCQAVGNTHISIPYLDEHFPLCNVALNWSYMLELGIDVLVLTEPEDKNKGFIVSLPDETKESQYGIQFYHDPKRDTFYYPAQELTVLTAPDE